MRYIYAVNLFLYIIFTTNDLKNFTTENNFNENI